ncbi:MAG: DNA polymerase III subunit gamma/tau, partial [Alphaproteobacteria bacterium]|nr:DNA polymerase III subunit gamma/tau [Alphaproteobacteria bacterium]
MAGDPYRVLARKHRPQSFAELVGQDALVRTLTNAIERDRIAHAFVLTGVRGIGKTSTARIIARALNCIGADGKGGPTVSPCGVCEHCAAIAEDRHMDVIEMDAASHTGVDNMRELIESARYRPTSARFKLYIIDEVHMLSASAFNALLKTLEEPPEHVKFVLATTEIRKVPVTVLSRCQRFDLKRLDRETLTAHLSNIAKKENATIEDAAMAMIVRAADGSVRDGLSLLDQAIALGDDEAGGKTGGKVTGDAVRGMLGLADQARIVDLFDLLMVGKIADALTLVGELYRSGADPVI